MPLKIRDAFAGVHTKPNHLNKLFVLCCSYNDALHSKLIRSMLSIVAQLRIGWWPAAQRSRASPLTARCMVPRPQMLLRVRRAIWRARLPRHTQASRRPPEESRAVCVEFTSEKVSCRVVLCRMPYSNTGSNRSCAVRAQIWVMCSSSSLILYRGAISLSCATPGSGCPFFNNNWWMQCCETDLCNDLAIPVGVTSVAAL